MGMAVFLGMICLLFLSGPIAFVDVLRQPDRLWRAARESKLNWALLVWIGNPVGPLVYFLWVRRKLKRAGARSMDLDPEVSPPGPAAGAHRVGGRVGGV